MRSVESGSLQGYNRKAGSLRAAANSGSALLTLPLKEMSGASIEVRHSRRQVIDS